MDKTNKTSVLSIKSEMYAMVISIEEDFILNFFDKLVLSDIPQNIIDNAKCSDENKNNLVSVLRGLDIQSYIEICNANILKLEINATEKDFINKNLSQIISIRNRVMHPRPLDYFDYPKLQRVFQDIPNKLNCFSWEYVKRTKYQIENEPETLSPPPESLKKSEKIIENLPSLLDYEETSFVGRKKEIGEIKAQLNRRNVNILSIIGDGGVGKTATTLKLLYDMLDDPNCQYELIIWASLKTNELSDYDFKEIVDSIKTTSQMYERLAPFIASSNVEDTKNFIIELAQNFNTLFVLDNLETINTADIKEFIDEFSEYGKVLITSRIGLGEMEHRYKLNGLNDNDVVEYTNVLLNLYGFECLFTDEHKKHLAITELHSNPLAIKWFVRCLYNGQSENEILNHKEDVINFCMENVYEKLSKDAHQILDVLTIANVELSFPELMYYLEGNISDCTRFKYAINELGKCNFIDEEKFKRDKNIAVTDFANEFLNLHYSDVKHLLHRFRQLQTKLTSFGQQLLIMNSNNPFDIKSIRYQNKGELVAALQLHKAIDKKNKQEDDEAFALIKYAQELMPLYYENNLICAQIHGTSSPLKASSEYSEALKLCKTPNESFRVYINNFDFLIRMNDYSMAKEVLEKAELLPIETIELKIRKARVLSYIGEYSSAESILNSLKNENLSNNDINKINTMLADVYKRRSEKIDIRETQKRLIEFRKSYQCLEDCQEPDNKVFDYMAKILENLSYMYMDDDALNFILEILDKHYQNIKNASKYKEFKTQIKSRLPLIENPEFIKQISKFIKDYNHYLHLLKDNEAIVYSLKQGYGFCKNNEFPQGIYFSMNGVPQDINYGDILCFSTVLDSKGKLSIIRPKKIGNIDERIN